VGRVCGTTIRSGYVGISEQTKLLWMPVAKPAIGIGTVEFVGDVTLHFKWTREELEVLVSSPTEEDAVQNYEDRYPLSEVFYDPWDCRGIFLYPVKGDWEIRYQWHQLRAEGAEDTIPVGYVPWYRGVVLPDYVEALFREHLNGLRKDLLFRKYLQYMWAMRLVSSIQKWTIIGALTYVPIEEFELIDELCKDSAALTHYLVKGGPYNEHYHLDDVCKSMFAISQVLYRGIGSDELLNIKTDNLTTINLLVKFIATHIVRERKNKG